MLKTPISSRWRSHLRANEKKVCLYLLIHQHRRTDGVSEFVQAWGIQVRRLRVCVLSVKGVESSSRFPFFFARLYCRANSKHQHQHEQQQEGLRKAESLHGEALAELKRLHKEELEDTRRRNSDSKTLEALAGQVLSLALAFFYHALPFAFCDLTTTIHSTTTWCALSIRSNSKRIMFWPALKSRA